MDVYKITDETHKLWRKGIDQALLVSLVIYVGALLVGRFLLHHAWPDVREDALGVATAVFTGRLIALRIMYRRTEPKVFS